MTLISAETQLDLADVPGPVPLVGDESDTNLTNARREAPSAEAAAEAEAEAVERGFVPQLKGFGADPKRSLMQVTTTAAMYIAMLVIMGLLGREHYWLTLLLALPTAGLLVRLFIIQHDCGHGSYFKWRAANDLLGRVISVLTLTPYADWKTSHAAHHASNGNLDRRGFGDVEMLTVREYLSLTPMKRLGYRLYRHPLIMVLLGAPLNFIVFQRLPTGRSFRDRDNRRSILMLNAALVMVFGLPMAMFGVMPVLATYLPVMVCAAWIGNWLFYVQHQFEDAYWERNGTWNFQAAALRGSSYFDLPPILQWFSGNIGLHHAHHLCSRIPNYRLQAFVDSSPDLSSGTRRISLWESLNCWRLSVWDEERRRLVRFGDLEIVVT
jgi:acyl-lipid omega-6 desaturase (Delta-12 desaturase)